MKKNVRLFGSAFVAAALVFGAFQASQAVAADPPPTVTPSPAGATAYIVSPSDGETVSEKVTVVFGLQGMGVSPSGHYRENTGHHHLLVDMDKSELDLSMPLPTIEGKCIHFGGGQTEVTLDLAPGKHTLQMVLGNWAHIPHDPPVVSEQITITVAE